MLKSLLHSRSCFVAIAAAAFLCPASAAPVLWNTLGSSSEVLNSAYGPNLSFYSGGGFPDDPATPAFVPGVFGNALTIGGGPYPYEDREHNVIWNNVNNYLNADRGTISIWYKQNASPVAYDYGVYRIFDGDYGLGAGVSLAASAASGKLNFAIAFGGNLEVLSDDVSAYNGTWIHLAGVWDRAGIGGSADKLRFYVNGMVVASSTDGSWGSVVGQTADIGGGNDSDIAGKFAVDNLQVFDTAVTDFSGRFVEAIPEPTVTAFGLAGAALLLAGRRRAVRERVVVDSKV